jgi:hypothetical protein
MHVIIGLRGHNGKLLYDGIRFFTYFFLLVDSKIVKNLLASIKGQLADLTILGGVAW